MSREEFGLKPSRMFGKKHNYVRKPTNMITIKPHTLTAKPEKHNSGYCSKFNESCREHNREKYGRVCFFCGKTEYNNGSRLSVHHLDMNKDQGCNGHEWRLIPLCKVCHGKAHTDTMTAKLTNMYETRGDVHYDHNYNTTYNR